MEPPASKVFPSSDFTRTPTPEASTLSRTMLGASPLRSLVKMPMGTFVNVVSIDLLDATHFARDQNISEALDSPIMDTEPTPCASWSPSPPLPLMLNPMAPPLISI